MRLRRFVEGALIVLSLFLIVGGARAEKVEKPENGGKGTYYVVKKGDTLWSISQIFYGNPLYWPIIWGSNEEKVSNPHWIYPGEKIYVPRPSEVPALAKKETPGLVIEKEEKKPIVGNDMVLFAGYIAPQPACSPYTLGTSVYDQDRTILNQLERVSMYWTKGAPAPRAGDRFMVIRTGEEMIDPNTGKHLGWEIKNLATLRVEKVAPQEHRAQALLETVAFAARTGDYLVPLHVPKPIYYLYPGPREKVGDIVGLQDYKHVGGLMDYLFVNLGEKDGLRPGTVLNVYSPEGVDLVVGRLVVLRAKAHTSTCYLWNSKMPLEPGMEVTGGEIPKAFYHLRAPDVENPEEVSEKGQEGSSPGQ